MDYDAYESKGVLSTLNTCRALVALHLTTYNDDSKLWTAEDETPFLPLLPSNLGLLDVAQVQVSTSYIKEALDDSTVLPSLRKLVLADSTQSGDSWDDDETS